MKPKRQSHPTPEQIKAAMNWWRISAGYMRADESMTTESLTRTRLADHARIAAWHDEQRLEKTRLRRPDLLRGEAEE